MSYFNMVCDSCGREVYGCNIVNGMKFCAKCYQETFGETDKDRKIAELQKQLEEKEKKIEKLRECLSQCDSDRKFEQEKKNLAFKELRERSEQLRSQPAEIVEKIKEQLIKRLNTIAGYGRMTTDELSFLIEAEFGSDLDTILKEYQK